MTLKKSVQCLQGIYTCVCKRERTVFLSKNKCVTKNMFATRCGCGVCAYTEMQTNL